jgi:hypothetical protein
VDLLLQLVQAVVVLVLIAVILVLIPALFMIVFNFAYGEPAAGGAPRRGPSSARPSADDASGEAVDPDETSG